MQTSNPSVSSSSSSSSAAIVSSPSTSPTRVLFWCVAVLLLWRMLSADHAPTTKDSLFSMLWGILALISSALAFYQQRQISKLPQRSTSRISPNLPTETAQNHVDSIHGQTAVSAAASSTISTSAKADSSATSVAVGNSAPTPAPTIPNHFQRLSAFYTYTIPLSVCVGIAQVLVSLNPLFSQHSFLSFLSTSSFLVFSSIYFVLQNLFFLTLSEEITANSAGYTQNTHLSLLKRDLLLIIIAAAVLNAGYGFYQKWYEWPELLDVATQENLTLPPGMRTRLTLGRPIGFLLSPDLWGGVTLAGFVASLALVFGISPKKTDTDTNININININTNINISLVYLPIAALLLFAVVLSRSFGTWLATSAGFALLLLLVRNKYLSLPKLLGLYLGLFAVIVGAILSSERGIQALKKSAEERLENWEAAWHIFGDHPIFGVGFDRFAPAYLQYRPIGANITQYAHGWLWQNIAEQGFLGFFVWLLCPTLLGILLVRAILVVHRPQSHESQSMPAANLGDKIILAGACAYWSRTLIDYDAQIQSNFTFLIFVIFVAALSYFPYVLSAPVANSQQSSSTQYPFTVQPIAQMMTLTLSLLSLAVSAFLWTTLQDRDAALMPFQRSTQTDKAVTQQQYANDVNRLKAYRAAHPEDYSAIFVEGLLLNNQAIQCIRAGKPCDDEVQQALLAAAGIQSHPFPPDEAFLWPLQIKQAFWSREKRAPTATEIQEAKTLIDAAERAMPGSAKAALWRFVFSDDAAATEQTKSHFRGWISVERLDKLHTDATKMREQWQNAPTPAVP